MPTYKGRPVSAAKARFLVRKGKKLDAPPKPALADKPRTVTRRPEIRARATVNPALYPPVGPVTPSSVADLSDDELEKLTKPGS